MRERRRKKDFAPRTRGRKKRKAGKEERDSKLKERLFLSLSLSLPSWLPAPAQRRRKEKKHLKARRTSFLSQTETEKFIRAVVDELGQVDQVDPAQTLPPHG